MRRTTPRLLKPLISLALLAALAGCCGCIAPPGMGGPGGGGRGPGGAEPAGHWRGAPPPQWHNDRERPGPAGQRQRPGEADDKSDDRP